MTYRTEAPDKWEAELEDAILRGGGTPESWLEIARIIRRELHQLTTDIAAKKNELELVKTDIEQLEAKRRDLQSRYNNTMAQLRGALDAENPIENPVEESDD